ncbi:uncharacterized protein SPPG_04267 [Spizellomyces punctatus DAOM BR117]|uniref:Hcy-binding domain-containing protein n=1 Tax=Spizellomyces punctatus (strain DAOM BR117) TaxID=645134 RepID=A0A0L0HIB2_SPIPD|nr:uncharacterized protein SPPG_04267 [Spizellomyces punctatus DAOM BR117]KND01176.1 hypothetical protein SPPG_04267 [Spizellomyces punctatus DAOM BR117]|eukprot:XP_016609215.1 hypothetical protein SPPG_04267 [Spizellomyces punctatus DAOM BR117]
MQRSIQLAVDARKEYLASLPHPRIKPLIIAASLGSYGAYLADGSEYTGSYPPHVTVDVISSFHSQKARILVNQPGIDILAFETVPCLMEAQAIAHACKTDPLLSQTPAWVTFSCRGDMKGEVCHGENLTDCVAALLDVPSIVAVGINCTDPVACETLVKIVAHIAKGLTIICYANSGEEWDGEKKRWIKRGERGDPGWYADLAVKWAEAGARVIGGCCRTGPQHIRELANRLRSRAERVP